MKRVYIVFSTTSVGGAEKRFTDIWCALVQQGTDVHLVMDRRVHAALLQQREYAPRIRQHPNLHVLDFGGTTYMSYAQALWNFFGTQPKDAVVHYPLAYVPGAQQRFRHRLVVSWVSSSLPRLKRNSLKNDLMAWASFVAAERIDVLNPDNLRSLTRIPGLRRKVSLTAGGTHVDGTIYRPQEKTLDLVFLSRIEPEKQGLRLVRQLPEVHRMLQEWGIRGYRFVVCGDGTEAASVKATLAGPEYVDVPHFFGYSKEPEEVLGRASVFFSLQRTSNYPSKALAEAMASGAFPILTDTGESALMIEGCPDYALVPREFSAADIATALRGFLQRPESDRARAALQLAAYAHQRFSIGQQAAYFARLYHEVGIS
jgi:glycosyltransferase involved in cell wall biosynthesis